MSLILLEGGSEFSSRMSEPDMEAIRRAGGWDARIAILPTAAAPDHNHQRAGGNGLRWFTSLGATDVDVIPVIDRTSAGDSALAERIREARLIYLLGGFPAYLVQTLSGSLAWEAALAAHADGAILGGSSAGAMVLCQYLYAPEKGQVLSGLNILPKTCILPHHNTFGKGWAARLLRDLPDATLIGIDEETGALGDPAGEWTVHGAGSVILYRSGATEAYSRGQGFTLLGGRG